MVWMPPTDAPLTPPRGVSATESLARSVYSSNNFKKGGPDGEPGKVLFRAFEPEKDRANPGRKLREISTDRCQYLTQDKAVELASQRAERRGLSFYGWAIVTVDDARGSKRGVASSPAEDQDNPAHADITLPTDTVDDAQARNLHLTELAKNSCWLDCPADSSTQR